MYYVYMLANVTGTVVYTGVTNDVVRRVYEHKHNLDPNSFTAKYDVHKLVYFEEFDNKIDAMKREYMFKQYTHAEKEKMIEEFKIVE